jgi:hypothetical protein
MSDDSAWVRDLTGNKAYIGTADRDRWTAQGWSETLPPVNGEFVWMSHESDEVTRPALIPWGARDYWLAIGWSPSAPDEPVDVTRDQNLTDTAAHVPDGSRDDVLQWVGGDRGRAEQALQAEQAREKPRTTLVDALGRVGQPEDTTAATVAPSTGE